MRRTYFVRKESIPKNFLEKMQSMSTSEVLLSLGLADTVLVEMNSRKDAVLRCRSQNEGLLIWVDYKNDPTAIEVVLLLICNCVALGCTGAALAWIGNHAFGLQPDRMAIYTTRSILLGASGVLLTCIQKRCDRCFFPAGFVIAAASLFVTAIGSLVYLAIQDDVGGIVWILLLSVSWRRYWAEPLKRD